MFMFMFLYVFSVGSCFYFMYGNVYFVVLCIFSGYLYVSVIVNVNAKACVKVNVLVS